METLTESLAIEYLRRAVAEYGAEYVDPNGGVSKLSCRNVYQGESGEVTARCIAAQVLSYHSVSDDDLVKYNGSDIDSVIDKLEVPVGDGVKSLLIRAQASQDRGRAWGEIVQDLCEEAVD